MRTRKFTLCALAAIAVLATACSNDELAGNDTLQEGIVIKATAGTPEGSADTRLTHTPGTGKMNIVWAANDKFTVYESASNKTDYRLENGAGHASASFTGSWNAAPASNAKLYALYPASTATDLAAITLSLENQKGTADGLKDFNYMTASTTYSGTGDLAFGVFSHQVAIVKLVLTFPNDVTATEANNIGLKATGLSKSTVLNLTAGTCSGETAGDVTTGTNTLPIISNQLTAYLCVFPGSLSNAKAIATIGTDNYEIGLSNLTVMAGNMYTATVTMKKVIVATPAVGDYYYSDGTYSATYTPNISNPCIGIVFYLDPTNPNHGKIVSLDECDYRWGVTVIGNTEWLDGRANTAALATYINNGKSWDDFPILKWIAAKNNKPSGGWEESDKWYLPAFNEIRQLYVAISGKTWVASGADASKNEVDDWGVTALKWSEFASYGDARTAFNKKITDANGTAINFEQNVGNYASSTELYLNKEYGVFMAYDSSRGLIVMGTGLGTTGEVKARAIMKF